MTRQHVSGGNGVEVPQAHHKSSDGREANQADQQQKQGAFAQFLPPLSNHNFFKACNKRFCPALLECTLLVPDTETSGAQLTIDLRTVDEIPIPEATLAHKHFRASPDRVSNV